MCRILKNWISPWFFRVSVFSTILTTPRLGSRDLSWSTGITINEPSLLVSVVRVGKTRPINLQYYLFHQSQAAALLFKLIVTSHCFESYYLKKLLKITTFSHSHKDEQFVCTNSRSETMSLHVPMVFPLNGLVEEGKSIPKTVNITNWDSQIILRRI